MRKPNTTLADLIASLPADLQAKCHAYFEAKDNMIKLYEEYRHINRERQQLYKKQCEYAEVIDAATPNNKLQVGQIVLNLRNRRYYEVRSLPRRGETREASFYSLLSKTARRAKLNETQYGHYLYGLYGPRIVLPRSHPFVQKRANARLAERLEGKDV